MNTIEAFHLPLDQGDGIVEVDMAPGAVTLGVGAINPADPYNLVVWVQLDDAEEVSQRRFYVMRSGGDLAGIPGFLAAIPGFAQSRYVGSVVLRQDDWHVFDLGFATLEPPASDPVEPVPEQEQFVIDPRIKPEDAPAPQ